MLDIIPFEATSDEDLDTLETIVLPLLEECTKHRHFRHSFHRFNVVSSTVVFMLDHFECIHIALEASQLIFSIFFRFESNRLDKTAVHKFLECKGPDLVVHMTKHYTEVRKIPEKQIILAFLPMIGLSEIPEGRFWLERNYISVSEYLNFFDVNSLRVYMSPNTYYHWCLEKDHFPAIQKVWKRFFDVMKGYETVKKERNIVELLEEEEREKTRMLRRKDKKKIVLRPVEEVVEVVKEKSAFETVFGEPLYEDANTKQHNTNVANDIRMIAQMFSGDVSSGRTPGAESSESNAQDSDTNSICDEVEQINININSNTPAAAMEASLENNMRKNDWKTVHPRKQMNKEKNKCERADISYTYSSSQAKSIIAKKAAWKPLNKPQKQGQICITPPTPTQSITHPNLGAARWADVAKTTGKPYVHEHSEPVFASPPAHIRELGDNEFPSLHTQPSDSHQTENAQNPRPSKMTFHFYSDDYCPVEMSEAETEENLFMGDMVEYELAVTEARLSETNQETTASQQEDHIEVSNEVPTPVCNVGVKEDYCSYSSDTALAYKEFGDVKMDTDKPNHCYNQITQQHIPSTEQIPTESVNEIDNSEIRMYYQILKHQMESFQSFYHVSQDKTSDPFISLRPPTAEEPHLENSKGAVDALFETMAEIPQRFEDTLTEETVEQDRQNLSTEVHDDTDKKTNAPDIAATDPAIIGYTDRKVPFSSNDARTRQGVKDNHLCEQVNSKRLTYGVDIPQRCIAAPRIAGNSAFKAVAHEKQSPLIHPSKEDKIPGPGKKLEHSMTKGTQNTSRFPGFHETTKLSADYDETGVSVLHKIEQVKLEQLKIYYRMYQRDIMKNSSIEQDTFIYYAQMAGLTREQIDDYLTGNIEKKTQDPASIPNQCTPDGCTLPFPAGQHSHGIPATSQLTAPHAANSYHQTGPHNNMFATGNIYTQSNMQPQPQNGNVGNQMPYQSQSAYAPFQNQQQMHQQQFPVPLWFANQQQQFIGQQQPCRVIPPPPPHTASQQSMHRENDRSNDQKQQWNNGQHIEQQTMANSHCNVPNVQARNMFNLTTPPRPVNQTMMSSSPAINQTNIKLIQATQTAMVLSVRDKINEVYSSMIQAKVKSIRWKERLAGIRQLPPEGLLILGKIVIPKEDRDRVYLAYHR